MRPIICTPFSSGLGRAVAAALALVLAGHSPSIGETLTLKKGIEKIAEVVAAKAKTTNQMFVTVSGFSDKFDQEKTASAGIRGQLIDELKRYGIEHKSKAWLALTGEYQVAPADMPREGGKTEKVPAAMINYKLENRNHGVLIDTSQQYNGEPVYVTDKSDVAILGGLNVEVKPSEPMEGVETMNKALDSDAKSVDVTLDGTKVRPKAGSKFAVEILKAKPSSPGTAPPLSQYQPVRPILKEGVPYIEVEEGEIYAVNIINDQDFGIVGCLTVDGLSMFHFSTERKQRSEYWYFAPHQSFPLVGWHRSGINFDTFLVTEYPKGQDGKSIANAEQLGQINVEFRAAWLDPAGRPADEGTVVKERDNKAGYRSGNGPPTEFNNEQVNLYVGKFRASVTIRYDRDSDVPPRKAGTR